MDTIIVVCICVGFALFVWYCSRQAPMEPCTMCEEKFPPGKLKLVMGAHEAFLCPDCYTRTTKIYKPNLEEDGLDNRDPQGGEVGC